MSVFAAVVYATVAVLVGVAIFQAAQRQRAAEAARRLHESEMEHVRKILEVQEKENAHLRLRLDWMRRPDCEMTPRDATPDEWARRNPQDA